MQQQTHEMHAGHALPMGEWAVILLLMVPVVLYLAAAWRQHRRQRSWSRWRTLGFMLGAGLIALALSPPVSSFAHQDLRGHMAQHLLIGMFAPLGLVMAAPITLLLRTLPARRGRLVARLLRCQALHLLSHPAMALLLNMGGMYVLYLTPLYRLSLLHPALHALINLHFLAAGYLYAWSIAGPDPAPRRPGLQTRIVLLIAGIGAHAFLAQLMYAHLLPRGVPFDADEVRDAAVLMYYGGDLAELFLAVALFGSWYQGQQRRRARLRARPVLHVPAVSTP